MGEFIIINVTTRGDPLDSNSRWCDGVLCVTIMDCIVYFHSRYICKTKPPLSLIYSDVRDDFLVYVTYARHTYCLLWYIWHHCLMTTQSRNIVRPEDSLTDFRLIFFDLIACQCALPKRATRSPSHFLLYVKRHVLMTLSYSLFSTTTMCAFLIPLKS